MGPLDDENKLRADEKNSKSKKNLKIIEKK